jgi:hypothetical protein
VSHIINPPSFEGVPPTWLPGALRVLAWSADRTPLNEESIHQLTAAAEPFISFLKQKQLDSLFYLSCAPTAAEQLLYDKVWSVQRKTLVEISQGLADEGIEFFLFKGSECSERWYQSRGLGLFGDVDFLVARHDIGKVKAVLYQSGFRQAHFDPVQSSLVDRDVVDIAVIEGQHYELAPFIKLVPTDLNVNDLPGQAVPPESPLASVEDKVMVAVEFDVHHGVATDIEVEDITGNPQTSAFGFGLSFSDSNQLWFLTSRYYTEVALHGKTSLRDFCYLLPVLAAGTIDWDVILRAARKYELRVSLFYYLSFMSALAGNVVPAKVLSELSPMNGTRLRDWGWQLGKLFDFVEMFPLVT